MAVDLRTYVFLDSLQLQNASFIATISKGYYPRKTFSSRGDKSGPLKSERRVFG